MVRRKPAQNGHQRRTAPPQEDLQDQGSDVFGRDFPSPKYPSCLGPVIAPAFVSEPSPGSGLIHVYFSVRGVASDYKIVNVQRDKLGCLVSWDVSTREDRPTACTIELDTEHTAFQVLGTVKALLTSVHYLSAQPKCHLDMTLMTATEAMILCQLLPSYGLEERWKERIRDTLEDVHIDITSRALSGTVAAVEWESALFASWQLDCQEIFHKLACDLLYVSPVDISAEGMRSFRTGKLEVVTGVYADAGC